jgi:hypothetical protein
VCKFRVYSDVFPTTMHEYLLAADFEGCDLLQSRAHSTGSTDQQRTGPSRVERSACTKQDDDGVCTLTFSHTAAAAMTYLRGCQTACTAAELTRAGP